MGRKRRHLRPVQEGERAGDPPGDVATVIEDLEVAHGHVVEAQAEAAAIEPTGSAEELEGALFVAEAAVGKAIKAARKVSHPSGGGP